MNSVATIYPAGRAARDRWIVDRRPARKVVDASRAYASFVEDERAATGEIVPVATIFLTNQECPWRCVMCDLWQHTLEGPAPAGSMTKQIDDAVRLLPDARHVKLYNSGSFFDVRAVPVTEYEAIATLLRSFERVIVECHPLLVGENCFRFAELLNAPLEVAMGLETADPVVLEKLNKGMTLAQFSSAAARLRERKIDLRVFILVKPPFTEESEALSWACRSLDFAFDCGATAVTLIPTRTGNGALDQLALAGEFAPPKLLTVERALEYGLSLGRGRVFVDLWDDSQTAACAACKPLRSARLQKMNLGQTIVERISCNSCGVTA